MKISSNKTPSFNAFNFRHLSTFFLSVLLILLMSCSDSSTGSEPDPEPEPEPEPQTEQVSEQDTLRVMVEVIQESGLNFPDYEGSSKNVSELSVLDYAEIGTSDGGLIELKLWVGPEGNIIPNPDWQEENPDYCSAKGRYMKNAVKLVNFKILSPTHEVQINYIDVETGKIEESVIGEANDDSNWLTESMKDAWDQMQAKVSIGGTVDACGEKYRMKIHFHSEITTDLSSDDEQIVYFENVESEFGLTFNEDKNAYTGTGDLIWNEYSFNGTPGDVPTGKSLEIVTLITPNIENELYDEAALELELPGFEDGTPLVNFSWPLLHDHEKNEAQDNYKYIILDWNTSGDASVVMSKTFDRTKSYTVDDGSAKITELTTIEITRE